MDHLFDDTEDMLMDTEAEDYEESETEVIEDEGSDIDSIAGISDHVVDSYEYDPECDDTYDDTEYDSSTNGLDDEEESIEYHVGDSSDDDEVDEVEDSIHSTDIDLEDADDDEDYDDDDESEDDYYDYED